MGLRPKGHHKNAKRSWFRGGLVFKAHRLVYHSTLGLRVMKKRKIPLRSLHRTRSRPLPGSPGRDVISKHCCLLACFLGKNPKLTYTRYLVERGGERVCAVVCERKSEFERGRESVRERERERFQRLGLPITRPSNASRSYHKFLRELVYLVIYDSG